MINILLKFFMFILNTFATILLSPIYALINLGFPNLAPAIYTNLVSFFDKGFELLCFFLDLFMVPSSLVILYLSITSAILVFNLTIRAYSFALALYHYFKL